MNDKPVTVTFLVGGLLWALWHWRRQRLDGVTGGATSDSYSPEKGQDGFQGGRSRGHGATGTWDSRAAAPGAAPFDAGARLAGLAT
jgi:hypothetical protein